MVERVLSLVATQSVDVGDEDLVEEALALAVAVAERSGSKRLRRALVEGLLRLVETYLLSDGQLLQVSRYWESYLGRERDVIRKRVAELLNVEPSTALVEYIRSCLAARTWRFADKTRSAALPQVLLLELFERVGARHPRREIRCACCGFHFRREDVGQERVTLLEDLDVRLALTSDPRRKEDPLKPLSTTGDRVLSLTGLTVDHIVPVIGFGPSSTENLRVVCQFCNGGSWPTGDH